MPLLRPATVISHYEVLRLLGSGGMGEVYEARDLRLGRVIALKILPEWGERSRGRVWRFLQEARTASALNHPNITTIYDIGSAEVGLDRIHYIAMELVNGRTLRTALAESLPLNAAFGILLQIADGLSAAHAAGIVHRDLKPENIMVTASGQGKLLDFGLAKVVMPAERFAPFGSDTPTIPSFNTDEGMVLGTVGYMAPEQVRAEPVHAATDIFAFGCIVYEVIVGAAPFSAGSALDTLHKILYADPPPLPADTINRFALQRLLDSCLAKDRAARLADGAALLVALNAALGGETVPYSSAPANSFDTLPQRLRETLSVAAVIGSKFSVRDLEASGLPADQLDDQLDELVRTGVLVESESARGGSFSFARDELYQPACKSLSRSRRKELHRREAERLASRPNASALEVRKSILDHYYQADQRDQVVALGRSLARDLLEAGEHEAACVVAEHVMESAEGDLPIITEATLLAASAHAATGRIEQAFHELRSVPQNAQSDPLLVSRIALHAAKIAWEARRLDEAKAWLRRGIKTSPEVASPLLLEMLSFAIAVANVLGDVAEARVYAHMLESLRPDLDASTFQRALERGGTIAVPSTHRLISLDPIDSRHFWHGEIMSSCFETLTKWLPSSTKPWLPQGPRVVPWLAEYVTELEGHRYRFVLREHLLFNDGRRVTSADVAYSFLRLLKSSGNENRWMLSFIAGATEVILGEAESLAGFEEVDERTFTLTLQRPVAHFPTILCFLSMAIVARPDVQTRGGDAAVVGTGPYRLVRFESGKHLELEPNPHYWRAGLPKNDRLLFLMGLSSEEIVERLKGGHLSLAWDLDHRDVAALKRLPDIQIEYQETPRLATYFLAFNSRHGVLSDRTIRTHVFRAVDVARLLHNAGTPVMLPARTLIPPGLLGAIRHGSADEIAPLPAPGAIRLRVACATAYRTQYRGFFDALCETLASSGFIVEVGEVVEGFSGFSSGGSMCDLFAGRWYADYPDASAFADALLHSRHGVFCDMCASPLLDALIEKAGSEQQPHIRHELYNELETIVRSEALVLPLFHEQAYCFARPEVRGLGINFSYPTVPFEELWIDSTARL